MKVAILGATGMIGTIVTKTLAEGPHELQAIVRDTKAASIKLPPNVKLIEGDVLERKSLLPIREADVVLVMLSIDAAHEGAGDPHPELEAMKHVVEIARLGKPTRILYLSALLLDYDQPAWWVLDMKRAVLALLHHSGIAYTVFKPSNFMENLPARNLRGKTVSLIGKPQYKNWWIAAQDFGRQIAAHLDALPSENREYIIQGPEAMDTLEIARRFVAVKSDSKLKVAFAPLPILKVLALFNKELKYAVTVSEILNRTPEQFRAERTWAELGKPTTTIEKFAKYSA